MKLHRFYLPNIDLTHEFWMDDERLFHQWSKVLRFEVGRELVLFNDKLEERLYRIERYGDNAVKLVLVTEREPQLPKRELYLCFALLKKDKNEWVLQKGTELGVRHFIPLLTERTEKTGFDVERAEKIVIEASEQCGRTDIPRVREPLTAETLLKELKGKAELFVAEQGSPSEISNIKYQISQPLAVLIGPEGGWSDSEKQLFQDHQLKHLDLSDFTLRAETAAIAAATLLQ
ncbi:MAG TPA: RsmE family RNA methyltransferase [Candidatus Saccharibacteria bacterium]|jgi:16S rRNA (uracil1498-N3)-methyltransferase|nr:RsmE family RNA methyltransferase [Candidatus Saccharibacteria bacterium]HMT55534.1 RsmE family RNA methyltransferase [Candidatus Saccharibacteria bacterium]